jgi:hypothetical protein
MQPIPGRKVVPNKLRVDPKGPADKPVLRVDPKSPVKKAVVKKAVTKKKTAKKAAVNKMYGFK